MNIRTTMAYLVLLALVDKEYRFLWVEVGSSIFSSDAEIFNHSRLKKNPWGRDDQICTTSFWVAVLYLDSMASENIQQKTDYKERENSKLQYLQRQKGCEECECNPCKQIRGPAWHNAAKAKGCQRHCFNMCFAQHAEDTLEWGTQGSHPSE